MAAYNVRGIVVGVKNWGDADKSVTLFTKERGTLRAIAFGCRRPRSPLAAPLQLLNELDAQLTEGRRVDTIRQATIVSRLESLATDITAMGYASLVAEFVREFLPEGQPEPEAYETFLRVLAAFRTRNPRVTAQAGIWQLMEYTGMQLSLERCVRCGRRVEGDAYFHEGAGGVICTDCELGGKEPLSARVRELILRLRDFDWQERLQISGSDLMEAERILLGHVEHLLGRPLHALAFIRSL